MGSCLGIDSDRDVQFSPITPSMEYVESNSEFVVCYSVPFINNFERILTSKRGILRLLSLC